MDWAYIAVALCSAGFLIYSIIDFLNVSSGLKPRAFNARKEIETYEKELEEELSTTGSTKHDNEELKQEIADMERELQTLDATAADLEDKQKRRQADRINPTD
jgi:septal ring factor EnvC (AmiA/AmiB activator)